VVILHDRAGRRYRLRLAPGATYSLHSGSVEHDSLIGQPDASLVTTNRGTRLLALRPTFAEQVVERRRRAQPIYPKDLGAILFRADLYPGAIVVEAGTGTGALTVAALRAVGPEGRVISYELREDFLAEAKTAIEELLGALPGNLELKQGDISRDLTERDVDRLLLDLPEPWEAVAAAALALRPGGIVFAHCPNVSQVQRFSDALRAQGGFGLLETVELLERSWTVRGRSLRPSHRMVAHTGFLTFARRLAGDGTFETEGEGYRS
jgi:tRNA (adenine57-N1/adenine58-N1)-methyltransferase catalytic subunit